MHIFYTVSVFDVVTHHVQEQLRFMHENWCKNYCSEKKYHSITTFYDTYFLLFLYISNSNSWIVKHKLSSIPFGGLLTASCMFLQL